MAGKERRRHRGPARVLRRSGVRARTAGTAVTTLLALAVGVSLAAAGGTGASWAGSAVVRAPSLTSGSIVARLSGFSGLSTTFTSSTLARTAAVQLLNAGTVSANLTVSTTLSSDSSPALAAATGYVVWAVTDPTQCTPSAVPQYVLGSGTWNVLPVFTGTVDPGVTWTVCVRSRTSAASLASSASFTPTVTFQLTVPNTVWKSTVSATAVEKVVADPAARSGYTDAVRADGALHYWRLGEASGPVLYDWVGTDDAYAGSGLTRGTASALLHDPNGATSFTGDATGTAVTRTPTTAPQTFTEEAWFRTTSTVGGKIIGFGDASSGSSGTYDRHLYLDGTGHLTFGVYPGSQARVTTPSGGYNDGRWHQAVGVLGPNGQQLYVDGALVGGNPAVTSAQAYTGYWHLGGDSSWDGTSPDLKGDVDEVAVYGNALTASQVKHHWAIGTGIPEAAFTSSVSGATASFDATGSTDSDGTIVGDSWDFGDGSVAGSGTTATHTYARSGTYPVALTVTDDSGATDRVTTPVTIADVFPPTAPGTPSATANLGTSIELTWPAASDDVGVTAYDVYRDDTLIGSVTAPRYSDTGLTADTTYRYTVRAIDAAGNASADSPALAVTTAASGTFQVTGAASGLCVDGVGSTAGSPLTQQTCASPATGEQTFRFVPAGGGSYSVVPVAAGTLAWAVSGQSTATGAPVVLAASPAGSEQHWTPAVQADGSYTFTSQSSGLCLEVADGSVGAGLQQNTCLANDAAQTFGLLPVLG